MDTVMSFLRDFGAAGLFIHAMIDAIIFPVPAFFLQVSLSAINPSSALWLATLGFIGCLAGTPIGYAIGKVSGNLLLSRILKPKRLEAATSLFNRYGEAAILVGAFTPIPFKLFTILSGCMNYPLWKLMVYAALGRAVKFYAVGILFYIYGRAAERMVGQQLAVVMMGIGGLLLIGWYLIRKRQKRKDQLESKAIDSESQEL